jgi:hypothetical protein
MSQIPEPPVNMPKPSYGILTENISEIQKMLNYVVVRKTMRWSGIWSIVFGALAIVIGVTSIKENPINCVLVALGIFMFVEGIWLINSPTPVGVLVDAIAFVVIALWNIFIAVLNIIIAKSTEPGGGRGFILGIFQLVIAGREFARYKSLKLWPTGIPSDRIINETRQMMQNTIKANPAEESDIFFFNTADSLRRLVWKARLFAGEALFVETKWQMAMIEKRGDVSVELKNPDKNTRNRKAVFKIGGKTFKGTINQENLSKYNEWKSTGNLQ